MKHVIVSVTNDLTGDNRVHKVCLTLTHLGFSVLLTGREYRDSKALRPRTYSTKRMRLLFRKGPLFYAEYNLRLWLFLLFHKADLLLSNDLDTLPANILAGYVKRKPIIFDSHELFPEVPELIRRPRIKKIWERMEALLVPRVWAAYTVSRGIADHYANKYGIPFKVVRNLPLRNEPLRLENSNQSNNKQQGDASKRPFILYQGALNLGRGLEQAIVAMQHLPEADLVIAGTGDLADALQTLTRDLCLNNVQFKGLIPLEDLTPLTRKASLGISIEEDLGLNYHFALPNKLFDYIQAQVPVVVTNLPEMSRLVKAYDVGLTAASLDPEYLAALFRQALFDDVLRTKWKTNLVRAAEELTWENEKSILEEIFKPFLSHSPDYAQTPFH